MPEVVEKQENQAAAVEVEKSAPTASSENGSNGDHSEQKTETVSEPTAAAAAPKEMRAVVLTAFGNLKNVKVLKKPEPVLANGEVLIRVKDCGLGFQDLHARQGSIDNVPKCPFIMGFECAGVVEEIAAEGVETIKVGDKVVAFSEYQAWAELVAVHEKYVYVIPEHMSFGDAVTIVMNFVVAHILLFDLANLVPGKSVLVYSAAGGVGLAISQLCHTVENVKIIGICSKSKHENLKISGAYDHLIERNNDYSTEVRKIFPNGLDIVLDCMGGEECNRGYALLKPMGRYILYGSSSMIIGETKSYFSVTKSWWQVDKVSPMKLFDDNKSVTGFNFKKLLFRQDGSEFVRTVVQKVFNLWQKNKIVAMVDSTWALEDIQEAMQYMHSRQNVGKIIIDTSLKPKPKPLTPIKSKDKKKQLSMEDKKDSVTNSGAEDTTNAASVATNGDNKAANAS